MAAPSIATRDIPDLRTGSDVEIASRLLADAGPDFRVLIGEFGRNDPEHGWQPIPLAEMRARVHPYDGMRTMSGGYVNLSRSRVTAILKELASMCAARTAARYRQNERAEG